MLHDFLSLEFVTVWCFSKVFAWASRKTPNIELNSGQGWDLFWSDWREAFLISGSYGMGDPMAPSEGEGNSEGGGCARRIASRQAKRAGITRP
jgi:hypothetical protein